ncbi:unnamed protein product, partial [Phaeothamnion confervicola]
MFLFNVLLFFSSALPAVAKFRTVCDTFAFAYMDPIVTPHKRSGHEHSIAGTLGFADATHVFAMRHSASTCDIIADQSNYWVPTMFLLQPGKAPVRLTPFLRPYWEFNSGNVEQMDATILGRNLSMEVTSMDHIRFVCEHGGNNVEFSTNVGGWHTDVSNCIEVRVDYTFPSCWNGNKYSPDQSHTAYPVKDQCPSTHPRRFVQMRLEQQYIFDTPLSWSNGNAPFVFSSGGAGTAHADATLLWDVPTLKMLQNQCPGRTAECHYIGVPMRDQ